MDSCLVLPWRKITFSFFFKSKFYSAVCFAASDTRNARGGKKFVYWEERCADRRGNGSHSAKGAAKDNNPVTPLFTRGLFDVTKIKEAAVCIINTRSSSTCWQPMKYKSYSISRTGQIFKFSKSQRRAGDGGENSRRTANILSVPSH